MNNKEHCVAGFFVQLSPDTLALPISRTSLQHFTRTFRYFSRSTALKVAFKFKYGTLAQKREALSLFKYQDTEKDAHLEDYLDNFLNFTDEEFCLIAKELIHQYQENDSSFLDIYTIRGLPNGCEKELSILEGTLAEHPILLFRAVEKCVLAHRKESIVSRSIVLLLSENKVSQTLGLRTLGFKFEYRVFLLPYVKEIAALLLAMHKSHLNKQELLSSQNSFALPLIESLRQMKSIQQDLQNLQADDSSKQAEEVQVDDSSEQYESTNSNEINIFEKELINFIEMLENQVETSAEYQKKLMHLANSIITLLSARLESNKVDLEATKSISESTGEKYLGILYAAATNVALAKKIVQCEQANNLAMMGYQSALADLKAFIKSP